MHEVKELVRITKWKLEMGIIQKHEIKSQLQAKGLPSFMVERLENQIREDFERSQSCY